MARHRPPGSKPNGVHARVRFRLLLECISRVEAPVLVVGRYVGSPPVGALRPLDDKLHGWLKEGIDRGIIGSLLGELCFIPATASQLRAQALIVAGMGDVGHFGPEELSYL